MPEENLESQQAKQTAEQVDRKIEELLEAERKLEHGYAALGGLLMQVHTKRLWAVLGYRSFGQYMTRLSERYNRGRSQLYHYFGTVKELSPYVGEGDLNAIGISKASQLRLVARSGALNPALLEKAKDPKVTVKDLRKVLFDLDAPAPNTPRDSGEWLDLEFAFYVSPDEKKVITSAVEAARKTDPVTSSSLKPWQQNKDIALKWAMEFLSAHSGVLADGNSAQEENYDKQ